MWYSNLCEFSNRVQQEIDTSDTIIGNKNNYADLLYPLLLTHLSGIKEKETIVIKTSVTGKRARHNEISPELLETILSICRTICPLNPIILCDGPAYVKSYYKECIKLGWEYLLKKYDVTVVDLNYDNAEYIAFTWPVATTWLNAARGLNVSKAKTHKRFGVSLATKNLIGTLPGQYLGFPKLSNLHEHVPKLLLDLLKRSPRTLNIIDGINGVEGNGPMHGRVTCSNFVVMGTNAYACDIRAIIEMGFHPAVVPSAIRPFDCLDELGCQKGESFITMRNTHYDFLPSFSCSWMYKSLYKNHEVLEKIYLNLLEGIKECWLL